MSDDEDMISPRPQDSSVEARFDQFVRSHARPVLAYCMRRAPRDEAEEAAADVFAVAWRRFEEIPTGDAARYWLLSTARRVLSNQRRARRRRLRLARKAGGVQANPDPGPETMVIRSAEDREVLDALLSLPSRDREVLTLLVWDEVPRPDAAELLGISLHAVHKRYQRALRRFETSLERGVSHRSALQPRPGKGGVT